MYLNNLKLIKTESRSKYSIIHKQKLRNDLCNI